ncbi:MAG: DUF4926 domain-containing protein [Chloroflexota bacterium]|nr:DUF4926 domain-containing protein [Chloroflexota bacterium]
MPLPSLSVVRLTTNAYRDRGLVAGDLGTILDVYDDKYEVDFSRPATGETVAWFALPQDDVELVADPNAISVASPVNAEP